MKTVPPTTAEGIERYLGSGLVKGIGPVLAKKLVERFGAEVLAVIENRAAELQTVDGIGPKRRERIAHAWQEARQVREIMLFLHSHGVSNSRAVRIFKTYGERANRGSDSSWTPARAGFSRTANAGRSGTGTSERRPAVQKSASQIAVQSAVQKCAQGHPKTPKNHPESTILHNNMRKAECVTNRLLYQLSYVGFWFRFNFLEEISGF